MHSKKLSLIVPVYNVEKYIEKCLTSCLSQNEVKLGSDYEIIIINDGTPDNSMKIVKNLIDGKFGITIINQENKGLSMARNNGLDIANGEYIWFIDSDDYIEKNCLSGILKQLEEYNPDLMHLNYRIFYENSDMTKNFTFSTKESDQKIYTGIENLSHLSYPIPAQMTIYKRDFLIRNNLKFFPGILHEDLEFKPRAVYKAKRVTWHKPIVYNFLKSREGSITTGFTMRNALSYIKVIENIHKFNKTQVKDKGCIRAINSIIGLSINNILYGLSYLSKENQLEVKSKLRQFKPYFKDMIQSSNYKYFFEGLILIVNLNIALSIYRALK